MKRIRIIFTIICFSIVLSSYAQDKTEIDLEMIINPKRGVVFFMPLSGYPPDSIAFYHYLDDGTKMPHLAKSMMPEWAIEVPINELRFNDGFENYYTLDVLVYKSGSILPVRYIMDKNFKMGENQLFFLPERVLNGQEGPVYINIKY